MSAPMIRVDARVPGRDVQVEAVLRAGVTTAVLGPNGAGKSTLLGLIAGTVRGTGTVRLGERELTRVALHERRVTHLAQDPTVFEHLSVLGNAMYGPRSRGVARAAARERAGELLASVGLDGFEGRRASRLSGGQAQRLALARALATDPDAVLFDEPFSALDVTARAELRSLIARLLVGRTTVLVTHDLLDVLALADDVLVLEDGRVAQHGPRAEVLERPRARFLAQLLGATLTAGVVDGECVRTDGGLLLPFGEWGRADGRRDGAVPSGTRVHVLVDPSAVTLEDRAAGAAARIDADGAALLHAQVEALDRVGADLLVRCAELSARIPLQYAGSDGVSGFEPGVVVALRVPAEAVRIYPEERELEPAP